MGMHCREHNRPRSGLYGRAVKMVVFQSVSGCILYLMYLKLRYSVTAKLR